MGLTGSFEQKFLFSAGRHLSNIFGIGGFVAVLTGLVLFRNSFTTKTYASKKTFIGEDEKVTAEMIDELEEKKNKPWESKGPKIKGSLEEFKKEFNKRYEKDISTHQGYKTRLNELKGTKDKQDQEYRKYVERVEFENNIKLGQRVISPFIVGYGFVAIASAAATSALFSIERNTRKD